MESAATAGYWLSPQQKYVWSLQQQAAAYRSVCIVRLDRSISPVDMASVLNALMARHEILRTIYARQAGMRYPFQVVLQHVAPKIETVELSGFPAAEQSARLAELFEKEKVPCSGPEQGPVVAAKIVLLGSNCAAVLLSIPAIAADRQSLEIVLQDLTLLATGAKTEVESEPVRYIQFAQWQNDLVPENDENAADGLAFWKEHAGDALPLAVPHERKTGGQFRPAGISVDVEPRTLRQIESLVDALNASSAEVLLAAWQSLLWRVTGQTSYKVGVVFDGREYEELHNAVGVIAKTIPINAQFDADFRFRELVEQIHTALWEAAAWQEYFTPGSGFGVEAPVVFEYAREKQSGGNQRVFIANDPYKLKLTAVERSSGLSLEFNFDSSRFDRTFIERVAGYFLRLLAAAVSEPDWHVNRLPLLDDTEKHMLLYAWNNTEADYPREKCFHELFEAQVSDTPDRLALRFRENALTYAELNEQANQMAHFLRASGVGPDSLVGICIQRSIGMMVALLAILKAGAAYVPLNPDNPKLRLSHQLSGAGTLITESRLLANLPEFSGKTICFDRDVGLWSEQPRENPTRNITSESLAYVIYTSGSTGVPKGVAVRHRNLVNYSYFITELLRLRDFPEGLNFGTVSTIGADLGNTCIFPALISGGCVYVVSYDDSMDPKRLAQYVDRYPIDVLKIVPSHLQALLQSTNASALLPRKFLILGGEKLTPKLVETIQSLGGSCEILNHYGPTETTVGSLTLRLADYDSQKSTAASIPLGRPIANTQVYILDAWMQPLPAGAIGELYIAGDGVTTGYVNQPERTAERFVENPFVNDSTARMYRTGDLARYLPDGNVEFLGRSDDQVKIRGFRIELGEIESILAQEPGIKQAVVVAKDDVRGDKRLVAYVVSEQAQHRTVDRLRTKLKERLPDYMIPSAIIWLAKIPLSANGKVDRQLLPDPEAVETKTYAAPKTPTEETVAKIWSDVLGRDHVSTDDNFFELGGHSLLATQVISRIREHFRVELPIRALFESPTICGLAEVLEKSAKSLPQAQERAILRVSRDAYRAPRS